MGDVTSTGAALLATTAIVAGCGGQDQLVISAASSLETAFEDYGRRAGLDANQSFAGSDELAAQIRQGVAPDVYAAADSSLPQQLHEEGLVAEPVVFATNRLVLAVPAGSAIDSLGELARGDHTVAIGERGVPVGDYTREVLSALPERQGAEILDRVRTEEPDVSGLVGKLTQGAVDAGFVYATDVAAAGGALEAITLPGAAEPRVAYAAAVVKGADDPEDAERFIDGLLEGEGAQALRAAGFGPPPR